MDSAGPGTGRTSILVAVDPPGAVPDSPAIDALAVATDWPVVAVNAVPEGAGQDELDRVERELIAATGDLLGRGIGVECRVLVGPPVDVIMTTAESVGAGIIVVVGRRHDVDGRIVMGSVTASLLKVADRPVLVLPAGPGPSRPGFTAAVERLLDLLERDGVEDDEAKEELRQAATARLPAPPSETASRRHYRRLLDALHRFETDHPSLTEAVNDVAHYLSAMGI